MSETQLFLSFGRTLGIKYRTHVNNIIPFLNAGITLAKNPFVVAQFTRLLYSTEDAL